MSPKVFLPAISLALYIQINAQTGPAGVDASANNLVWLKADVNTYKDAGITPCVDGDPVYQWNDRSGNGKNALQAGAALQPVYKTNIINGLPVLRFDGTNDCISSIGIGTGNQASVFVVAQFTSLPSPNPGLVQGSPSGLAFSATASDKSVGMWVSSATNDIWGRGVQSNGTQCNISQTTALAASTFYIMANRYNGATINQYVNNAAAGSVAYNGTLSSWTDFGVGRQAAETWNGDIAEVIVFNSSINDAQRILIDNYLSSKYNVALALNDKYAGDTPGNGNYDSGISGIGQSAAGSSNTSFSHSIAGGMGLTYSSGFDDGDYILSGYASATNWEDNTDVGGMTGASPARWMRDWFVDVTNSATNMVVNIAFDFNSAGVGSAPAGAAANYVLLYRAGTAGNWTEIVNANSIAGTQVNFTGVTLTADGYYTLGTHNKAASGLPIELTGFYALPQNNKVFLHWETATEINNKEFTIEHSTNGVSFSMLTTVASKAVKGNSLITLTYDYTDANPLAGTSYYRLKQTDYNGKFVYFDAISVSFERSKNIIFTVFPNPNQGQFTVDFTGIENNHEIEVTMYDQNGRLAYQKVVMSESLATNTFSIIPEQQIASGVYMVNFVVEGIKYPVKVIVQ